MNQTKKNQPAIMVGDYSELREHEIRETVMVMVDGGLTLNRQTTEGGTSARVFDRGYWGFSSTPRPQTEVADIVINRAATNARAMSRFGSTTRLVFPGDTYQGEQRINSKPRATTSDCVSLLELLHETCKRRYPTLTSAKFVIHDETHHKALSNSLGSDLVNCIDRVGVYLTLSTKNGEGRPVELTEAISGKGGLADLDTSTNTMESLLENLYENLQAKRQAVPVTGGQHTVVLSPELTGILAHEAMGHPCEADIVLGGAVTGGLLGEHVASDCITMVDFAHSYNGEQLLLPVYADDEGTPARDAVLIENGVLRGFMNSRETAAQMGCETTGNARGFSFNDEPLVRMRNTAILPGTEKIEDMIAGVERGYYLIKTGNGEADSTTEFMFGIDLGYEIIDGKLGSAIADTTVSGTAINMLKTVDAVSDDMYWSCSGYCGKKQLMVVSMGGPALRGRAHLGGE